MTPLTRRLEVVGSAEDIEILRVAFATTDRDYVNQHFGSARAFAIFSVGVEKSRLLSVCEFSDQTEEDNEDRLPAKIEQLSGCAAIYCRACGASAVRQLLAQGIQPVRVTDETSIDELLAALQEELRAGPSSWLAKAIQRQRLGPEAFDSMEAEGWDE
ncbi:NifB/NifX family molybdenum-iron cluster-binding protein [Marinobacterium mangrovicola]|uniref:Nitrogen fixation protein NifX n=1 Tax=Marinobacterium mangrovicola TaxID=1476959 RepID=A0A4R1GVJ9_9GAMM|nr:NifB/NifX family molybdenum-iron cluster-binding protein [Marinobacterium mangrovicola]TCK08382.1 nitrogen fixation protein NifX [Marinobacterium mangrovicola]